MLFWIRILLMRFSWNFTVISIPLILITYVGIERLFMVLNNPYGLGINVLMSISSLGLLAANLIHPFSLSINVLILSIYFSMLMILSLMSPPQLSFGLSSLGYLPSLLWLIRVRFRFFSRHFYIKIILWSFSLSNYLFP